MINTISPETATQEIERLSTQTLDTHEERANAREELAEIFDVAFIDYDRIQKGHANLVTEMPNALYFNPDTAIITLTDETDQIQAFSILQKLNDDTYYMMVTAARRQGQGFGTALLEKQDEVLKQKGIKYLVAHVQKDKGYANKLKSRYATVEPEAEYIETAEPDQETLKLVL